MKIILAIISILPLVLCDVSHIVPQNKHYGEKIDELTTPPPPPKPYAFGYAAGRFPGHIDRTHTEISDGSGVVKGSYSYVDPKFRIRTVDYIADKDGFHPVLNHPQRPLPADSPVVAAAKDIHHQLYAAIANQHQQAIHPETALPRKTVSVAKAEAKHFHLFQKIAEDHARIAAEREAERATAIPEINYNEYKEY